ncbi:MAG: hypothetical protein B5M49_02030 [Thermotoga sp. 4484_232]|nr:MAG: hypothetical protein B5M49_02030 [Thermotoga sp. 4484_232]
MAEIVAKWRENMVENIVEANDDIMEKYLDADKDEVLSGNRRQKNCHARDLIYQEEKEPEVVK